MGRKDEIIEQISLLNQELVKLKEQGNIEEFEKKLKERNKLDNEFEKLNSYY